MTYAGVRCPVCNKKYGNSDDIVVCPVCGAPHHRECYFVSGECVFASEHMSGKAWQPHYDPGERPAENAGGDAGAQRVCADCGGKSPPDNLFCNICGNRLDGEKHHGAGHFFGSVPFPFHHAYQPYDANGAMDEKGALGELTIQEYALYIGQSSRYYLLHFKHLGDGERLVSLNIPALICGFLYYFYRKMYFVGGVLLIVFLLGTIPFIMWTKEALPIIAEDAYMREMLATIGVTVGPVEGMDYSRVMRYYNMMGIVWTINFLISGVVSFLANRLYYAQATRTVCAMSTASPRTPHASATTPAIRRRYAGPADAAPS
jgi:hypothetical protein